MNRTIALSLLTLFLTSCLVLSILTAAAAALMIAR